MNEVEYEARILELEIKLKTLELQLRTEKHIGASVALTCQDYLQENAKLKAEVNRLKHKRFKWATIDDWVNQHTCKIPPNPDEDAAWNAAREEA